MSDEFNFKDTLHSTIERHRITSFFIEDNNLILHILTESKNVVISSLVYTSSALASEDYKKLLMSSQGSYVQ